MPSFSKGLFDNERFLNIAIRTIIALVILVILVFVGYRYYFYNVQLKEEIPVNQAVKQLEEQVRKNPLDTGLRIQLASAYISLQRWDDAIQQCHEVLKVDKENQDALTMAGFAYMKKGEYDKALEMYQKEIDIYAAAGMSMENKSLEEAYFNSGVIYWKKGDLDKAIYHVNRAALIRRTDADVWFFLGRLYYEKGLLNNAEKSFQKSIKFVPNFVDAHIGLGKVYEKMGLLGLAINEYERAYREDEKLKDIREKADSLFEDIQNETENPTAENLIQLGFAYIGRHEFDKAYEALERASELEPKNPKVYYALGYAYEREWAQYKGNDKDRAGELEEKARKYYNKCLELDKDYQGAHSGLQRLDLGLTQEEVIERDIEVRK